MQVSIHLNGSTSDNEIFRAGIEAGSWATAIPANFPTEGAKTIRLAPACVLRRVSEFVTKPDRGPHRGATIVALAKIIRASGNK